MDRALAVLPFYLILSLSLHPEWLIFAPLSGCCWHDSGLVIGLSASVLSSLITCQSSGKQETKC